MYLQKIYLILLGNICLEIGHIEVNILICNLHDLWGQSKFPCQHPTEGTTHTHHNQPPILQVNPTSPGSYIPLRTIKYYVHMPTLLAR